jgi:hypothetical protein
MVHIVKLGFTVAFPKLYICSWGPFFFSIIFLRPISYTYIHVCMYACVRACIYACKYVCVCVCVCVCMYVCMCVCVYACMHACMYVCMYETYSKLPIDRPRIDRVAASPCRFFTRRDVSRLLIDDLNTRHNVFRVLFDDLNT